jgi:hypothetical protein
MPVSQQQSTIKSGLKKAGRPLGSVPANKLASQLPEMAGRLFNRLKVVTGEVVRTEPNGKAHLLVECQGCKVRSLKMYSNLVRGVAGCRECGNPRQAPKWLVMRAISAKQRCTNPKDKAYERYGARGICFEFSSPTAMAVWVQENLGLHRSMELDRIDNDGHYAPGNLRYLNRSQNQSNKRGPKATIKLHVFREQYPDIRYSDGTLRALFGKGLTAEQIIERYMRPSAKPKGVYGTFSTPDQGILSLLKGS